jgi:hypothetical protein
MRTFWIVGLVPTMGATLNEYTSNDKLTSSWLIPELDSVLLEGTVTEELKTAL